MRLGHNQSQLETPIIRNGWCRSNPSCQSAQREQSHTAERLVTSKIVLVFTALPPSQPPYWADALTPRSLIGGGSRSI